MVSINCGNPELSIMRYLMDRLLRSDWFGKFNVVEAAKEIYDELDQYGYVTLADVNKIVAKHSDKDDFSDVYGIFGIYNDTVGWYDDKIRKNCIVNIEDLTKDES